ncbi:hypothetical protein [Photobacterium rosenbergii]|uniref:DUF3265 domain-containing protein n=1 Tax=Photobacterium rosenbergii TaxID=294936 RepID=A0ABU3ZIA0_9GAMM|nr:hypothetical protein [Photobacterium rosenbergii]MDV5169802.1 hypothetical protein [Photobacterium rosenbergii]
MSKSKLNDDLIHAKANYWILNVICGVLFYFILNGITNGIGFLALLTLLLLFIGCAFSVFKINAHIKVLIRKIEFEI